ncbi:MAG: DNA replication and repair protein RecF [Firmicutes bacterium]|nr:DNA replication and repair protein RecF [Bacillota bacterium]
MKLKKIQISNFRNIKSAEIEAGDEFNLVIGNNAQGKSNFLEAFYALCLGKSYKAPIEEDVISFNENCAVVIGWFYDGNSEFSITLRWEKDPAAGVKKTVLLNGNPVGRLSEFLDQAPAILMIPDDLEIIRGAPDNRRKMLDLMCCRVYPPLVETLRNYKRILDARNSWLKLPVKSQDPLLGEIYEKKLSTYAGIIVSKRLEIIDMLRPFIEEHHNRIFRLPSPDIRYRTSIKNLKDRTADAISGSFLETLHTLKQEEQRRKFTMAGPHRDDFDLKQKGKTMKHFASFGEMRSSAALLKLAEVEIVSGKTGKSPVALIDDCLNEFDTDHMENFLRHLYERCQMFYTSTGIHDAFGQFAFIETYFTENGAIRRCSQAELKTLLKTY